MEGNNTENIAWSLYKMIMLLHQEDSTVAVCVCHLQTEVNVLEPRKMPLLRGRPKQVRIKLSAEGKWLTDVITRVSKHMLTV